MPMVEYNVMHQRQKLRRQSFGTEWQARNKFSIPPHGQVFVAGGKF